MKLPAIMFYPGDWHKDAGIQALSYEERGIWFELLLIMHDCNPRGKLAIAGKPINEERLSNMLNLDKQKLTTVLSSLLDLDVARIEADTKIVYSKRMVDDERLREIRSQCGSMGGNPKLLKGKKEVNTHLNQNIVSEDEDSFFLLFYQIYPRKEKPADAKKAWKQKNGDKHFNEIRDALEWQMKSDQWTKDGGKYIPLPASYLRSESWLNEKPKSANLNLDPILR